MIKNIHRSRIETFSTNLTFTADRVSSSREFDGIGKPWKQRGVVFLMYPVGSWSTPLLIELDVSLSCCVRNPLP